METPDNPFAASKTTPPEFDVEELRAPGTACFRFRKAYWITAFICGGLSLALGAAKLTEAFVETAQSKPIDDDIGFAVICLIYAFLSILPIAWFLRVRLWFTPRSIVYRGLTTQAIPVVDINRIVWRINQFGAVIEVHGPHRCINIRLESFEWRDQNAMIAAMRSMFPHDIQTGWNEEFEMRLDYVK